VPSKILVAKWQLMSASPELIIYKIVYEIQGVYEATRSSLSNHKTLTNIMMNIIMNLSVWILFSMELPLLFHILRRIAMRPSHVKMDWMLACCSW
jgi:hypothetical protein